MRVKGYERNQNKVNRRKKKGGEEERDVLSSVAASPTNGDGAKPPWVSRVAIGASLGVDALLSWDGVEAISRARRSGGE